LLHQEARENDFDGGLTRECAKIKKKEYKGK